MFTAVIRLILGCTIGYCAITAVEAAPNDPAAPAKPPAAISDDGTSAEEQPMLPESKVRALLAAMDECKLQVHTLHDRDLACVEYKKKLKDAGRIDVSKMTALEFWCSRVTKDGKIIPMSDAEVKKYPVSEATNKLASQMMKEIEDGYNEHYGCSPVGRKAETIARVISNPLTLKQGEYNPEWMTKCFRPQLGTIVKDDEEFLNVFGKDTEMSEGSLRALIRALQCPTNRINLDSNNPWSELEKLPTTVRQHLNQFLSKTFKYMGCFWDIKFKHDQPATWRQVFDCDEDGKFYKKAVECANNQEMEKGFEIKFPATLRDYHKGRNGEGKQTNAKQDILTQLSKWGFGKMCGILGRVDALSKPKAKEEKEGVAGSSKLEQKDIPQFSVNDSRRKRKITETQRANIVGFVVGFLILGSIITGGTLMGIWCSSTGDPRNTAGGAIGGAVIGAIVGIIGAFVLGSALDWALSKITKTHISY